MLGLQPIQSEIDKRKLYFLGKLCNMETNLLPKRVFTVRLFEYLNNNQSTNLGFVNDISRIIQKYSLDRFILTYVNNASFPSKNIWKNIVKQTVNSYYNTTWKNVINTNSDFTDFKFLQSTVHLASLWTHSLTSIEIKVVNYIANLWTLVPKQDIEKCIICSNHLQMFSNMP